MKSKFVLKDMLPYSLRAFMLLQHSGRQFCAIGTIFKVC
jgi:hypothetical protein